MTDLMLVLAGAALMGCSGIPALASRRGARTGAMVACLLALAGAALGTTAAFLALRDGRRESLLLAWDLAPGRLALGLDALSAAFLAPVFVVPALGTLYGVGYWSEREHPSTALRLRSFYGLMPAAMVVVLLARDGGLFLVAWEVMAVSAFFLISADDEDLEVRRSAWVYFVATHAGTLCLLAMFALLRGWSGSLAWDGSGLAAMPQHVRNAVFVLALVGFGIKAGLVPLHVWLPPAHANSPSHVSAVLSGVMLKMGVYGLVRTLFVLPDPPVWWGVVLLSVGAVSALFGIVFAVAQTDLKRLLAYSSIENIGIIVVAVGLACLGRSTGRADLVLLGLAGALLHVWNHALFKPLLFFVVGSVQHATGTRRIERLGGLARVMPRTAALCLIGCVGACALPPLNGFASELLVYLGLFRATDGPRSGAWIAAPLAATTLALAGALAVAAFSKLFGGTFLGLARSEATQDAHDPGPSMLAPMTMLALCCALIGIAPWLVTGAFESLGQSWIGAPVGGIPGLGDLAPLKTLTLLALCIWIPSPLVLAAIWRAMSTHARQQAEHGRPGTWDCGYVRPTPRMQYTGRSMSQAVVGLFSLFLWPRDSESGVTGLFPRSAAFAQHVPDVVLDRLVLPVAALVARLFRRLRVLQQGQIQVYVLYVLAAVVILFVAASLG
jgi:hydrogenase-4 component B